MNNLKFELNQEQAQALLGLIDLAVKTGGLQVASTAVFFHSLLEAARAAAVSEKSVGESPKS